MRKYLALILILFMCSCHSISKKQTVFSDVDRFTIAPVKIVEINDKIYFFYESDEAHYALSADIPKLKAGEISQAELKIAREIDVSIPQKAVTLTDVTAIWDAITNRVLERTVPKQKLQGVVLNGFPKDVVLYRDASGKLNLDALKDIPENVKIVKRISEAKFSAQVVKALISELKKTYPHKTKFIFRLKDMPLVPYVYIDTSKGAALDLRLPDFYEFEKQLAPFGFELKMIYSFFIKSHLFEIVKAPVTSGYRLLSTSSVYLFGIFPDKLKPSFEAPVPVTDSADSMDLQEFNSYLDTYISDRVEKGSLELLIDGEEFFSHFLQAAAGAKKNISVRLYVFCQDPFSLTLADMLKRKSNDGIKVKVLLDDLNLAINWVRPSPKALPQDKYVMPNIKKYLKEDSKVKVRTQANTWVSFAHQKVIVIDDDLAYTGGMNFGEDYRYFWHDMMVALRGPVVLRLQNDFNQAWVFCGVGGDYHAAARALTTKQKKYKGSTEGMTDIRILYTTPASSEILRAQLAAIKRAKRRIYVSNPYFSHDQIIKALVEARARGVDVRVIMPTDNNVGLMDTSNSIKANTMLKNGIRIYKYKGMTHLKAAIYDDWVCLGSANFDNYSLNFNQEMNIAVSDKKFAAEIETKVFEKDFSNSDEVRELFDISWTSYITNAISPM
jgi:cardiolipin synthase